MTETKKASKTTKRKTSVSASKTTPKKTVNKSVKQSTKSSSRKTSKVVSKDTLTVVSSDTKILTPFKDHLQNSWTLFKATFTSYLKLIGVGILFLIVLAIAGVLLGLPLIFTGSTDIFRSPTPVQIISGGVFALYGLAAIVASYIFFLLMPIASIYILDSEKKLDLKTLFDRSVPLLLPYFVASLLVGIIVTGGWVALVLPGILFGLLFSFVSYVIVLEGKKGRSALKRSYALVKGHFWEVILRLLALQITIFFVSYIFDDLSEESDIFSLLSFIFSIIAGWFSQAYVYLLYRDLKATTASSSEVSLKWIWIVSIVGWVILLLVAIAAIAGVMHLPSWQDSLEMMVPPPDSA